LNDPNVAQPIVTPTQDSTSYSVTVTTATGCTAVDSVLVVWVDPCGPIPLTSVAVSEATCGNTDGTAIIHLGGAESNYTYNWMPNIGIPNATGNERIGLPAGGYTVEIIDAANPVCRTFINILIQNSAGPEATATIVPASCGLSDGSVSLMPAGFTYTWEDATSASSRNDLAAGVYFVTVVDPADPTCPNVLQIEVEEDNAMQATFTVNTQPDCGTANGSVTINVTGGLGPYSFSWGDNTATQNNLTSGVYAVTITDLGTSGCELEYTFALTDNVLAAIITIADTSAVSCAGATDGAIDFSIAYDIAFAQPADTIITDGLNTYTNNALPEGDYCMIIRDANGCIAGESCFSIRRFIWCLSGCLYP